MAKLLRRRLHLPLSNTVMNVSLRPLQYLCVLNRHQMAGWLLWGKGGLNHPTCSPRCGRNPRSIMRIPSRCCTAPTPRVATLTRQVVLAQMSWLRGKRRKSFNSLLLATMVSQGNVSSRQGPAVTIRPSGWRWDASGIPK